MLRKPIFLLLLLTSFEIHAIAQKAADVLQYIATYKELAISEMKRTGVPAAIKLAQGIHETEAGKSDLVVRSNNHFGIKCKTTWTGDKVFHDDDARGECFRSYGRSDQSYMDHSDFLKNSTRYAFLFELDPTDYEGWAYGLRKAGYATNVRYSRILISLIETYHLQDYTMIALGRIRESDHILVSATSNSESYHHGSAHESNVSASYPTGQFTINKTKVIYAKANTAWLAIAEEYGVSLSRLWDFNDLESDDDILVKGQLVFLQRKRKLCETEFHIMQKGETLYDVSQAEGIRLESLLELNHLKGDMQPAVGEKLYLQVDAPEMPMLAGTRKNNLVKSPDYLAEKQAGPYDNNASYIQNPAGSSTLNKHAQSTTHKVSPKETLFSISRKYGVSMENIKEWNRLDNLDVKVGQELIIY